MEMFNQPGYNGNPYDSCNERELLRLIELQENISTENRCSKKCTRKYRLRSKEDTLKYRDNQN